MERLQISYHNRGQTSILIVKNLLDNQSNILYNDNHVLSNTVCLTDVPSTLTKNSSKMNYEYIHGLCIYSSSCVIESHAVAFHPECCEASLVHHCLDVQRGSSS